MSILNEQEEQVVCPWCGAEDLALGRVVGRHSIKFRGGCGSVWALEASVREGKVFIQVRYEKECF